MPAKHLREVIAAFSTKSLINYLSFSHRPMETTDLHKINYVFWVFCVANHDEIFSLSEVSKIFRMDTNKHEIYLSSCAKNIQSMNIQRNWNFIQNLHEKQNDDDDDRFPWFTACLHKKMNESKWMNNKIFFFAVSQIASEQSVRRCHKEQMIWTSFPLWRSFASQLSSIQLFSFTWEGDVWESRKLPVSWKIIELTLRDGICEANLVILVN